MSTFGNKLPWRIEQAQTERRDNPTKNFKAMDAGTRTTPTSPLIRDPLQSGVPRQNETEPGILGHEDRVQFAFKDLMIRLILQFTLHIAFRGVLHRCENLEIHR